MINDSVFFSKILFSIENNLNILILQFVFLLIISIILVILSEIITKAIILNLSFIILLSEQSIIQMIQYELYFLLKLQTSCPSIFNNYLVTLFYLDNMANYIYILSIYVEIINLIIFIIELIK
jgi:hypothetical protein